MTVSVVFVVAAFALGVLLGLIFGPAKERLEAARVDGYISGMNAARLGGLQLVKEALHERINRTLSDHGRMLWRDEVEHHCDNPDVCFEHGDTVRCSPCAIKQAAAAGVATLDPDRSYLPEVCRLKREVEELRVGREQLESEAVFVPMLSRAKYAGSTSGPNYNTLTISFETLEEKRAFRNAFNQLKEPKT